ncbi:MAG: hypothetical protein LBD11_08315, partial [Candidatus Peribacteria bacterium]|nr:hypothetical protein [Candidatus Peribacteria bacterium]
MQKIPKIIFAVPKGDGSREETTQVEVEATADTLRINGALITNVNEQNKVSKVSSGNRNFSILGGKGNEMEGGIGESTIIGGRGNKIISGSMSVIGGGSGNSIKGGSRSTIIGGKNNSIEGEVSTIIGGEGSKIVGSGSTSIGTNNSIKGSNALAVGSGVSISGDSSFGWNDGREKFEIGQAHVFAVKGARGVVVGKAIPNGDAALSIKGALRIQ